MDIHTLILVLCMLLPSLISGNMFTVTGNVYCDTCGAGYENEACTRHVISGARVRFECKDRDIMQVKYQVEGLSDSTGTYNILVKEHNEEDICDSMLVNSLHPDCAEDKGHNIAQIILTNNYTANANTMGVLREVQYDY